MANRSHKHNHRSALHAAVVALGVIAITPIVVASTPASGAGVGGIGTGAGIGTDGIAASLAGMSAPEQRRVLKKWRLVLAQPTAADQSQLEVCRALASLTR